MRVGTWKVGYAVPGSLNQLEARVREYSADIWVLTETHDSLRPPGLGFVQASYQRARDEARERGQRDPMPSAGRLRRRGRGCRRSLTVPSPS